MDLCELLARHDQGDLLRGIAEAVPQLIMETDVEGIIGAGRHERSGERTTWRNGYRERALDTRLGTLNLRVPKLRQGSDCPGFLEARKTSEQALVTVVKAQLGSPRRLRTIYDANLRSARAAGQWERIERTKAAFPYLEYRLGASEQHRPHHADKEGLILPVDSPFWDEWMPPNGWGCKCRVRPVTRREAERRGIDATPDVPDQKVVNKRTGEVAIVPLGIDPGWQRNPGKLRRQAVEALLRDRLEAAPEAVVKAALSDIARSWQVTRILDGLVASAPVALMPMSAQEAAGAATRIVSLTEKSKVHLVDEMESRGQASRAPFVSDLKDMPAATDGFVERRSDGNLTLSLFVDGLYPPQAKGGRRRGLYVVIWFDDGQSGRPRIRTLIPKVERSYWEKQAARDSAEKIDLK